MKVFRVKIIVLVFLVFSCSKTEQEIFGTYELQVKGMKNISKGILEIVGEADDVFGKIVFTGQRKRVYSLGLKKMTKDSLHFFLPGNGGFLRLKRNEKKLTGSFKYFGIKAKLSGTYVSPPSEEMQALVSLKPLGKGIISTNEEESFPSFDSKNEILYFTRNQKIFSSKIVNSTWQKPQILSFNASFNNLAPFVFNNGNSLLFSSNRPLPGSSFKKKNIWRVDKKDNKWLSPRSLPSTINIDSINDYHPTIAMDQTLYFISYNRKNGFGRSDIYSFNLKDSRAKEALNIGNIINSAKSEADVFINKENTHLLFASTRREDSYGTDDIYISFKSSNEWTSPINLGSKVNSHAYEYGAFVDEKNNFLYFNSFRRGTSDIYRISLTELLVFENKK
ncbi:MAG: hypothetical protein CMB99_14025 [Flavobacteriaceae bacterium]|nr:hypothetical protein [Flavobacteriaceae bacterium]|tara:strand:- start:95030 stop:96205 length:1176 start_codon:yes stop_codon:yes gene_type:complete